MNNCTLRVGSKDVHFLGPARLVGGLGTTASYDERREGESLRIDVVPVGGALGKDVCTARHTLGLSGEPEATDGWTRYPVVDEVRLSPCSAADRRVLRPVETLRREAELLCPR